MGEVQVVVPAAGLPAMQGGLCDVRADGRQVLQLNQLRGLAVALQQGLQGLKKVSKASH